MTEWFKVADCKSVRETYRRFESYFFQKRNITQSGSVPVLGTGSHVFKSHYFEILFNLKVLSIRILFNDITKHLKLE